jgi:hypothetical protein
MIGPRLVTVVLAGILVSAVAAPPPALAQQSLGALLGRPATPEGQPKTFLEELMLYGYVENSYVANLGRTGGHDVNELRFYDFDQGWTFNAVELSVKKDPSQTHRFGFGVVVTAGLDSQKNHSLGIFRDLDDSAPLFRNTVPYDLPEAYASFLAPLGDGLTIKAGRWATLIGYEGYETPKNLNFSRSFLYTLGTPYTHTGLLLTYPFAKWLFVTAGFTNGWDNADNNNGHLRPIGSFAFTPSDTLIFSMNWLVGPEQNRNQMRGGANNRWIVDNTLVWTGLPKTILAVNFDVAGEEREPNLQTTRQHGNAGWGGVAVYGAYDWTKALRTVLRLEYFDDADGVRNGIRPVGERLFLYEATATIEYKIWRGLVGRLEYRHDEASRRVFDLQQHGTTPTSRRQDTLSVDLYYLFF